MPIKINGTTITDFKFKIDNVEKTIEKVYCKIGNNNPVEVWPDKPPVPMNLTTATDSASQITISWDAAKNATEYTIDLFDNPLFAPVFKINNTAD